MHADNPLAKRAYLSVLLQPPPAFPPPAQIKPYDRPDAAKIIQSLAARSLGHRSSMSSAMQSGQFTLPGQSSLDGTAHLNPLHSRTMSMANPPPSLNSFTMPTKSTIPISSRASMSGPNPRRANSGSTSGTWGRQSLSGVLAFNSQMGSGVRRLPAHSESESSADDPDPMVLMDTNVPLKVGERGSFSGGVRRESVSADKAMREVQKALASVEAH
jgi:hypothetical protein